MVSDGGNRPAAHRAGGYIHAIPLKARRGFTLVEFVVGIVLLAVALDRHPGL